MEVFWVVAPCSLEKVYRHFRGACYLHIQVLITLIMGNSQQTDNRVNFFETAIMLPGHFVHIQAVTSAPIYSTTELS
jgi:hypothetical protein